MFKMHSVSNALCAPVPVAPSCPPDLSQKFRGFWAPIMPRVARAREAEMQRPELIRRANPELYALTEAEKRKLRSLQNEYYSSNEYQNYKKELMRWAMLA